MKKRILVVDDEADTVELIRFNLQEAGFDAVSAVDGTEALEKARTAAPGLIVLDVLLPELDGFEACKLLRRDPTTARFLTGLRQPSQVPAYTIV